MVTEDCLHVSRVTCCRAPRTAVIRSAKTLLTVPATGEASAEKRVTQGPRAGAATRRQSSACKAPKLESERGTAIC